MKIEIDREKIIDAIIWANDPNNYQNGCHGVHVQRWLFDDEDDVIDVPVIFYPSRNYYPPETPHVCEFGVLAFLDEETFLVDASWNDLSDSYSDLRQEAEEAEEDPQEWINDAVRYLREVVGSSLVSEIVCDGQYLDHETNDVRNYDHRYEVEYV